MPSQPPWSVASICTPGALVCALICAHSATICAQTARWQDDRFEYRRTVNISAEEDPAIVVTDFFAHGALLAGGSNLTVYAGRDVVPFRVMQAGPGDYCRVAIQCQEGATQYQIYYGGQHQPRTSEADVRWLKSDGLLLETRRWRQCDLASLMSVRAAWESADRIGSDYVPRVFHRHNPFDGVVRPFLSRYTGIIQIPTSGKYSFFTSSQDCSFVLIDGAVVVSAPGRHQPEPRAKIKGEVQLKEGPHTIEYLHAASGNDSCMVLAWQLPGLDKPSQISPSLFRHERIAKLPARRPEHRTQRQLADFRIAILGDVPSADPDAPAMVRMHFVDATDKAISRNGKYRWEFGDGQSSEQPNPSHIYLHPGDYRVTMVIQRGASKREVVNRVRISRSIVVERETDPDKLASYREVLQGYNAANLDPVGLVQLVRAYLSVEEWSKAVSSGKMAFSSESSRHDDSSRWQLIKLIGPLLRYRLEDAQGAADLQRAAAAKIGHHQWRVACALEAADIYLNDLLSPAQAKPLLELALNRVGDVSSQMASKTHRLWGDWYARTGDGKSARAAYAKAENARSLPYNSIQKTAWRGAHSRSTEAFLIQGELERARLEIGRWQQDYPLDKAEGLMPLLLARYWIQRDKYRQAVAVANDLLIVRPNSPFADQAVYLIALSRGRLMQKPQASAALQALLDDYPGSHLVDVAKKQLARLKAGKELDYRGFKIAESRPEDVEKKQ